MTRTTLNLVRLFLVSTLVALLLRLLIVENYRIASGSMLPSLFTGDLVLINKSAYNIRIPFSTYEIMKFERPKRGDVVAFTLPEQGLETFVKRVVAVEGDKVEIRGGELYVNEQAVPRELVDEVKGIWREEYPKGTSYQVKVDSERPEKYGPVDVPRGYFFAMGDNRPESLDSRAWGPVPYSCLKGKAKFVWFSADTIGNFRFDRTGLRVR